MPRFVHFLYLVPLCLGAIVSLRSFRMQWPRPYRVFSIFLFFTLVIEILAIAWKLSLHETAYWHYTKSNGWIYNLYYIPQYLFYFYFYDKVLDEKGIKKLYRPISWIYFLGGLINLCFVQGIFQLDTYSIIGGNLGVLYFSLHYFKQELHRSEPVNASKDPLFWISLGAFIFHTVSLPYFVFINYLSRTNLKLAIALFNILLILNIFMYSFYLIAFLCNKPSQKKPT